ncbi:uncharacterized protein SAPINGB_P000613 [Magnusiomyces paraingens]|uniref:alpha-1,2-Mannosidase n=1 Tax=Magnusiomyces paraingens TaxID=2606893 RepID=A0A5E8B184_9ASCO|nr:uncharacterized protein SAPINGB_P000613 [Saprochaete ingens]VVT45027.1 unnamed protein product [Saprochaete ingens]
MTFPTPGRKSLDGDNSFWPSKSKELPLYKDKPYSAEYSSSPKVVRRRKLIALIIAFFCFFYYVFLFGRAQNPNNTRGSKKDEDNGFFSSFFSVKPSISWEKRRDEVRDAFKISWAGYEKYAWGKDIYKPVSRTGMNMGPKPLGWIIVDSLDTLKIMGLDDELERARSWVKNELNYDMDYNVNTFETTIRMLGGLLSAHYLTEDDIYLDKATDLANRLMGAFDSPTGIPYASVNLHSHAGIKSHTDMGASSTAEVATLQLEFKYLSKLTGETLYWEKVENIMAVLDKNKPKGGLVPIYVNPDTGKYQGQLIRLGSRGDSYYEYLIKQYLQTDSKEQIYKEMYDEAVEGIKKYMVAQSVPNKLTYIGELPDGIGGNLSPKMDHLVCFVGGMLGIGATGGHNIDTARRMKWTTNQENDFRLAMELTRTCYELYNKSPTGLAPEIVYFNDAADSTKDFTVKRLDGHNLQRPETVESLFILWRLTKNPIYRQWGWEIFESFKEFALIPNSDAGFTSLNHVNKESPTFRDNMESFWLSETLKYLYLLFDDEHEEDLALDKIVFNTEAHPFPIFSMGSIFQTGWTRDGTISEPDIKPEGEKVETKVILEKIVKKVSDSPKSVVISSAVPKPAAPTSSK